MAMILEVAWFNAKQRAADPTFQGISVKSTPIIAALSLSLLLVGNPASAQTPGKAKSGAPANASAPTAMPFKDAKLAAMDAWLNANKTSPDRAEALNEAANLAFEISNWAKARSYAETYIKEFPKAEAASELQLLIGKSAASTPGGEAEARKIFEKAIADAGEDINQAVGATSELADLLQGSGDFEGAKKAYTDLGEKFKSTKGFEGFIKGKLKEVTDYSEVYGKAPKPIDVTGFDGKPINLDDLKGKVVLIDFWATWCGPCVAELPNVIATYKKLHAQGFEIVGISLDSEETKLKDFLASHEMPWVQFYDGKGWENEIAQAYGVQSIPATYLLDKEGNVRAMGLRGAALGRGIEKLLSPAAAPKK
ncbi:MAG TPA: TlpA disulfide reductase family protein [Planctomycetota bacterium]|nr:TlpA disulfide reductase family protein [Planctomycetota bacterium]